MSKPSSDVVIMRKLYTIAEKHLLDFLDYVPLMEKHRRVESPVIFNMMMEIGPQIEPTMVKLVELLDPQEVRSDFAQCFSILNKNGMLAIQKVITREGGLVFRPFSDSNPTWWQAYNNHIKHILPKGMEKATLENLLQMHAAIFILNCIRTVFSELGAKPNDLLTSAKWYDFEVEFKDHKSVKLGDKIVSGTDWAEGIYSFGGQVFWTSKIFYYVSLFKESTLFF